MPEIYQPSDDTFLLSEALRLEIPKIIKQNNNLTLLEIGSGSGFNLQTALSLGIKKENIFAVDINEKAVDQCSILGFNCTKSDLFENIKGEYGVIIFNPPYLPEDSKEPKDSSLATSGGKKGDEVILKFLKQARNFLKPNGVIFLLTSSLTPEIDFKSLGFIEREIASEKLFFEKLTVWELMISPSSRDNN